MINRKLTPREEEILNMIRPTTFHDLVDEVRRDLDQSRYEARRELRNLHNGHREHLQEHLHPILERCESSDSNDVRCKTTEIVTGLVT